MEAYQLNLIIAAIFLSEGLSMILHNGSVHIGFGIGCLIWTIILR